ncbi:GNAT family N-acetyltransferase [Vagococcus coleopterorum]|uniref:GNAT family N-acetyltransferase n=1 Tax=Vagococcus coleopterorum TaxID=2714946 RepID=A0A6G8APG4_9ENTE|nr:GNAT family N-acetyltransferase [Vagococcus coleopterorum]QIL46859.1 GNAT family N-acetyltransferase [Vagococcus coleopterorum]
MNIIYRPIEEKDFAPLEQIIRDTWNYDTYYDEQLAKDCAEMYLAGCLNNFTFSEVAVLEGETVGVILVNDKKNHHPNPTYQKKWEAVLERLDQTEAGRTAFNSFDKVEGLYHEMYIKTNKAYDGELAFFLMNDKHQGLGIGKKLYLDALAYFKAQGVESFYLFTDTQCNFGFYDHIGMNRIEEIQHLPTAGKKQSDTIFYMYEAIIN